LDQAQLGPDSLGRAGSSPGAMSAEKRIDPDDGAAYTWEEFAAFYNRKYKAKEVAAYWEECKPLRAKKGAGKGGAAATAEPKPVRKRLRPGDMIPDVSLHKGFPPEKVPLQEFCKGKKVVLVGLPGAFTPT